MIETKAEISRDLEKALQELEQAKQRVANAKKKQNEKKRNAENHHKAYAEYEPYKKIYDESKSLSGLKKHRFDKEHEKAVLALDNFHRVENQIELRVELW